MIDLGLIVFILVALFLLFIFWELAVRLVITTIIGAVILYTMIAVFDVDLQFSWWFALLIGIVASFIWWIFSSGESGSEGRVVKKTTVEYEEE
jgi:hypothetical protein